MFTKGPNNEDVLIKDQNLVERHIFNFYHRLYQHRQCHDDLVKVNNFLSGIDLKSVPDDYNAKQDRPISTSEIAEYLKTLSNNKAPGSSGITGALYKFFWSRISHLVTLAVNYCYQIQELPDHQRIGIICLISKQGKDPRYVKNLRPITLLSTFYKIVSGVITQRLKPALEHIVGTWQKAYLPGRYIGEVTRTTYDILQHAKTNNLPGIILLIDFSKAFDSISFEFILSALRLFKFSIRMVKWVSTLLYNFQSQTMINGNASPRITLGRGCRQGDPISGYLFILAIEILLLKLAASPDIIPWNTKGEQAHLLEGYADDLTLFLKHFRTKGQNIAQINAILKILVLYEDISGLAVNVTKTNM